MHQINTDKDNSHQLEEPLQPIATFILKTYAILSLPENASIICWSSQGNCFFIKDVNTFTKEASQVLELHSTSKIFSSQLNMYNFSKVRMHQGSCFANSYFLRGREDLLRFIKRKPQRKKKNVEQVSPVLVLSNKEQKENNIQMISQIDLPARTQDNIDEEVLSPLLSMKNEAPTPVVKQVCFAPEVREAGQQNLSTLMEASSKYIPNKEESCWNNIKSFKSIRLSMHLLAFEDEQNNPPAQQPRLRRLKSRNSFVTFDSITDN